MLVQEVGELYQIYNSGFSIVGGTPSILHFFFENIENLPIKTDAPHGFPLLKNEALPIEKQTLPY